MCGVWMGGRAGSSLCVCSRVLQFCFLDPWCFHHHYYCHSTTLLYQCTAEAHGGGVADSLGGYAHVFAEGCVGGCVGSYVVDCMLSILCCGCDYLPDELLFLFYFVWPRSGVVRCNFYYFEVYGS